MSSRSVTIPSPVGPLTLIAGRDGLSHVLFPNADQDDRPGGQDNRPGGQPVAKEAGPDQGSILDAAAQQLDEYFSGSRTTFDLPLAPTGSEFELKVWEALTTIPYGQTISYGQQARLIGQPAAAQAVGAANGRNPLSIVVPCHRVIGANGALVGFGGGIATKEALLELERGTQRLPF